MYKNLPNRSSSSLYNHPQPRTMYQGCPIFALTFPNYSVFSRSMKYIFGKKYLFLLLLLLGFIPSKLHGQYPVTLG